MSNISLDKVIKDIYNYRVMLVKKENIKLERKFFTEYSSHIPSGKSMIGLSYDDVFDDFKKHLKNGEEEHVDYIFTSMKDYFLFSTGHDFMFKRKLDADLYVAPPIDDLIYPKLEARVKQSYNNFSVAKGNPNAETNLAGIADLIGLFFELQSVLYLLYRYDFQFPEGWEAVFPELHEEIIKILKDSGMTIGDFLHALIDFKCNIIKDVLSEIKTDKLRTQYMEKIEVLRKEKHEETQTFAHAKLPVTYFLDHDINDLLNESKDSTNSKKDKPNSSKRILKPKNQ